MKMFNFYYNGAPVLDNELKEIESIECEETGEILRRFVINYLKKSPIFTEPSKQKIKDQLFLRRWSENFYKTNVYVSPFPASWISCDFKIT